MSAAQRFSKAFFDSSGIGEGITSALLVLVILVAVVWSMPNGEIRDLVDRVARQGIWVTITAVPVSRLVL